jgi:hypothetical protein
MIEPFALSKGLSAHRKGFDRLSPNGKVSNIFMPDQWQHLVVFCTCFGTLRAWLLRRIKASQASIPIVA